MRQRTPRSAISALVLVIILVVSLGYIFRGPLRDWWDELRKPELPVPVTLRTANLNTGNTNNVNKEVTDSENENSTVGNDTIAELPATANLNLSFTPQAPHANWEAPFKEACEETAALMVQSYWSGDAIDNPDEAETRILEIVDHQNKEYGFYEDSTAEETARFIRDLWGYETDVYTGSEVSAEKIRREVANGFPVIVLAAGRQLGNPNYTPPGPLYHALVVKGYLKNGQFITHDPGTRNGEDYLYDEDVFMDAIHDWNGGDVANGQKAIVVVRGAREE
ncbi:MAG: C39 family peptidase [bacterium]|nr:C39 family peptidase [bacterium]